MFILSVFSERLRELMEENHFTQTTLAKALQTPRPKIGLYMRAKHAPTFQNFTALLSLFGCSADYLLGLSEQSPEVSYQPVRPFGEQLRNILREQNMSVYAFQKKTGISWSVLYKWLGGKAAPSLYHIVNTAEILGVSADELLGRI